MNTYLVSVEIATCGEIEIQAPSAEVAVERALKIVREDGRDTNLLINEYEDTTYTGVELVPS